VRQRSRADLLYTFANTSPSAHDDVARLLGYEAELATSEAKQEVPRSALPDNPTLVEAEQAIVLWTIQSAQQREVLQRQESTLPSPPLPPLLDEGVPPSMPRRPAWSSGQLQRVFDQTLACLKRSRRLDVQQAATVLAQGEAFDSLPNRPRKSFHLRVVLLLDLSPRLRPVWFDLLAIDKRLRELLGSEACQLYLSHSGPLGAWRNRDDMLFRANQIPLDVPVLIVSDFDVSEDRHISTVWSAWLQELEKECPSLHLLGIGALRDQHWSPCCIDHSVPDNRIVDTLLTALSQTLWPNVAQLRELRIALGGSLSDELALYQRPEIERRGDSLKLPLKLHQERLTAFNAWPVSLQNTVRDCVSTWGKYLPETWREAERVLLQLSQDKVEDVFRLPDLSRHEEGDTLVSGVFAALEDFSCLLADTKPKDAGLQRYLDAAQKFAEERDLARPFMDPIEQSSTATFAIQQQHDGLIIRAVEDAIAPLLEITRHAIDVASRRSILAQELSNTRSLTLYDNAIEWQLEALSPPAWSNKFYRKPNGTLEAAHAEGARFEFIPASLERPNSVWRLVGGLWPWAQDAGIDDHGLWAELAVKRSGYRLRWIPPGTFMMGSPDDERGRSKNEQLHKVTLSEGYWLGETTVTQGLWEAVMGNNPSEGSKDARLPVNNVSWNDCSVFITSLQEYLPSFEGCLPTEAQWEYACRAGTKTPYWWGDEFSAEHGSQNDGSDIKPETRYPANSFGLKSMHGNLDEWCQDWYGEYPTGSVMDPKGPTDGRLRVLRGGSWLHEPRNLRAADRDLGTPGSRFQGNGLRLAGGCDPQAGNGRGAAQSADRDEGTEEQRGAQGSPSTGKDA